MRYELTNLDDDEVALLVQQNRATPAMQQAFDRILKQEEKIGDICKRKSRIASASPTRLRRTKTASART